MAGRLGRRRRLSTSSPHAVDDRSAHDLSSRRLFFHHRHLERPWPQPSRVPPAKSVQTISDRNQQQPSLSPPSTASSRPTSSGMRSYLLVLTALFVAGTAATEIPWRDHSALLPFDGFGLVALNGRTGTSTSRYGPYLGPRLTGSDLALFGENEFGASTNNAWIISSDAAEVTQAVFGAETDLRFGFSCTKGGWSTKAFCTGGYGQLLTSVETPLYTIGVAGKRLNVKKYSLAHGRNTGRGLHASAVLDTKLYMFGGMPCLFCDAPMLGINDTAFIDMTASAADVDLSRVSSKSVAPDFVPVGAKVEPLERFAGSCAVALPNGRALLIGGAAVDNAKILSPLQNVLWVFDPLARTFKPVTYAVSTGPPPGWGMSCALSSDLKYVYVHGGCDPANANSISAGAPVDGSIYRLAVSEIYSWNVTWTRVLDASGAGPGPRCFSSSAMYGDYFVIVGGQQKRPESAASQRLTSERSSKNGMSSRAASRRRESSVLGMVAAGRKSLPAYRVANNHLKVSSAGAESSKITNPAEQDQPVSIKASFESDGKVFAEALQLFKAKIAEAVNDILANGSNGLSRRSSTGPHHGLFSPENWVDEDAIDVDDFETGEAGRHIGAEAGFHVFDVASQSWLHSIESLAKVKPDVKAPTVTTVDGKASYTSAVIFMIVGGAFLVALFLSVGACLAVSVWKRKMGNSPIRRTESPISSTSNIKEKTDQKSNINILGIVGGATRSLANGRRPLLAAPSPVLISKEWTRIPDGNSKEPNLAHNGESEFFMPLKDDGYVSLDNTSKQPARQLSPIVAPDSSLSVSTSVVEALEAATSDTSRSISSPQLASETATLAVSSLPSTLTFTPDDIAEAARKNPTALTSPTFQRRASGRARTVGPNRFFNPHSNVIIPVLAPVRTLLGLPNAGPVSDPRREKYLNFLTEEFESLVAREVGDLQRVPLDDTTGGDMGLELASLPLRTSSLDAADPDAGVPISSALQEQLQFQCVYCHRPRRPDELQLRYMDVVVLRKFYRDGWAFGINYSLQSASGLFPIFIVEEAEAQPPSPSANTSTLPFDTMYSARNAAEHEPLPTE
ncbi:hypothetical protein DFJ73DRAFT_826898 [Zopfochytrium polystomum]|nr:hypothetical protein DFJ73DRAFT_826898 [Zopfochytrium polystomum]